MCVAREEEDGLLYNPADDMKELHRIIKDRRCLLFIDLEGTQTTHEMIEIGAYKVILKEDLTPKKIFKPYHAYVLAKHRVGPIVTKLTGITDMKLKKEGIPFRTVLDQLKKYLGKDHDRALLVSYGTEDARIILQSSENNMDASTEEARFLSRHFFDLGAFISRFVRDESGNMLSLTNALKTFEVPFEGTAHCAQDDAYNLFLLYKAFLEKTDIVKENYKNVLGRQNHLPTPIRMVLNRLTSGETVTPELWDKLVEESLK